MHTERSKPCISPLSLTDEATRLLNLCAEMGTALTSYHALQTVLQSCANAILTHLHVDLACIWTTPSEDHALVSTDAQTNLYLSHGRLSIDAECIGLGAERIKIIVHRYLPPFQ